MTSGLTSWCPPEAALATGLSPDLLAAARTLALREACSTTEGVRRSSGWPETQLQTELARHFGYATVGDDGLQALQPDFDLIAYPECMARELLVARTRDGRVMLVLSDPFDGAVEDWAYQRCRVAGLMPYVLLAPAQLLRDYLAQQEAGMRAVDDATAGSDDHAGPELAAVITLASIHADTSAVVKLVNSTLYDALKLNASDIHLECDTVGLRVLFRIDGVLVPVTTAAGAAIARQVISRVKVMAELDIAESRIPQDGRLRVRINGREIDLRVSIMPNIFGEDAVLRLLDRESLTRQASTPSLDQLGLQAHAVQAIRALAARPHGMLLVTGPTGSGKTTTLYAAIMETHTGRDKVITIEDPVEYRLPQVLQIPVNEKKGLGFARGLRSILRHDPDKIMVGEIRDGETAQIAVQAALTGHLVLSTVHANSVFDVLGRFIHMGLDAYSLGSALNGIVAQRLVRVVCPHCSQPESPTSVALAAAGLDATRVAQWNFQLGQGCAQCRDSGYLGRRCVAEVLVLDEPLRDMVAVMAPVSALREHAARQGMVPLRESLWEWVASGQTTLEEVARVAG